MENTNYIEGGKSGESSKVQTRQGPMHEMQKKKKKKNRKVEKWKVDGMEGENRK